MDAPELFEDQDDKVRLQGRNAYAQAAELINLIHSSGETLALSPEVVQRLHRAAITGIYRCAGQYRDRPVLIKGSGHAPPDHRSVAGLVENMCAQANEETDWVPLKTAAFLMWRLNWIHPFFGGNGRTSRAVAYLALCVRLGFIPPGTLSFTEEVVKERRRYEDALADSDQACRDGVLDVDKMITLLDDILVRQLQSHRDDESPPGVE